MKQALYHIYLEHKSIPIIGIIELIYIFTAMFAGIIFNGFAYGCFLIIIFLLIQIGSIRPGTEIEYFLPVSKTGKRKLIIIKTVIIAGTISFSNTIGYILTISFSGKYVWDKEFIFFIIVMTVMWFMYIFILRIGFENSRYFGIPKHDGPIKLIQDKSDYISLIVIPGGMGLVMFWTYFYVDYKFTNIFMSFFGLEKYWEKLYLPLLIIIMLLLITGVINEIKHIGGSGENEY